MRIVQALLTIHPFIKSERQLLIDLIEESFCKEIHQPCVKQLLQWLLFALLKNHNDDYFNHIKAKIDTATKTQPSTIASFIVVLLQLTLQREESFWFLTIEALIPWSMGANFKLRVYSQVIYAVYLCLTFSIIYDNLFWTQLQEKHVIDKIKTIITIDFLHGSSNILLLYYLQIQK